jgi:hypothetical protein
MNMKNMENLENMKNMDNIENKCVKYKSKFQKLIKILSKSFLIFSGFTRHFYHVETYKKLLLPITLNP